MDVLRATLPAGTLSGAPKVRAMQIIDELEPHKRCSYGGAIGYLELHRRPRHRDPHPHRGGQGRLGPRAGRRRHGRRREARLRVPRDVSKAKAMFAGGRAGREPAGVGLAMRVLVIDNYDSFTYNLVQYLGELGAEVEVVRNDKATVAELLERRPDRLVISPGPCTPADAGISIEASRAFPEAGIPTLGVCLGHQAMVEAFGGRTIRGEPIHGKDAEIDHDGAGIFAGLPNPLRGGRYHSLIADPELPAELERTRLRRRRRDGGPPSRAARDRRPVPPRVGADAGRQAAARELPRRGLRRCPTTSSPARSTRSPPAAT